MDKIDRMDLADIGHPRKMAEAVLGLMPSPQFPLPIDDVAMALDIRAIQEIEGAAFEGALLTNESKSNAAILVRAGVIDTRRRFTIGHELGHYLMPLHFPNADGFQCSKEDMRREEGPGLTGKPMWEAQANAFASELLMPTTEYRLRLRKAGGPSLESLVALSDVFGVSKLACAMTLMRVADDASAFVVSQKGLIRRVFRSRDFPFISLQNGMPLPKNSIASQIDAADHSISDCEPIDPCHWLSKDINGLELFEQTLFQEDDWALTMLTAEVPDDE